MPRKPNLVNEGVLEALKSQVKLRANLECNSFADMQLLQMEIRKAMNEYISLQTLNRLFGIIHNDFHPSPHTLNLLSQYLQYNSFDDFVRLHDTSQLIKKQISFESKFIFSLFSSVDPNEGEAQALRTVIMNILQIINDDPGMAASMYPAMASIPFGRKYFFEEQFSMDGLAKAYGNGLSYYLLYARNRQDHFYAWNLYCLRYFLTADLEQFGRYFSLIDGFSREEVQAFNPHYIGLYLASLIYNQSIKGPVSYRSSVAINENLEEMLPPETSISVCRAWYQVAEALVLTGDFQGAWHVINIHLPADTLIVSGDNEFVTQVNILRLLSGFYSGQIDLHRARQLFSKVNDAPLRTNVQNYFSILLLLLKKKLFAKAIDHKEAGILIRRLIKKTGFVYFFKYEMILQEQGYSI